MDFAAKQDHPTPDCSMVLLELEAQVVAVVVIVVMDVIQIDSPVEV